MYDIGRRIKERLDELGMAQRELADKAGLTEVSVCRYISGERTPKATVLAKIAQCLDTTTDYLMGADEEDEDDDVDCFFCTNADCKKYIDETMDGGIFGDYELSFCVDKAAPKYHGARIYIGLRPEGKEETFIKYISIKYCPFCGRNLEADHED